MWRWWFGVVCACSSASSSEPAICKNTDVACLTTAIERYSTQMCACINARCAHDVAAEMAARFDRIIETSGPLSSATVEPELSRSKAAMLRYTDCYSTVTGAR